MKALLEDGLSEVELMDGPIRSFAGIHNVKPGFDPHNVLTMRISTAGPRYNTTARLSEMIRLVSTRIEAIPGVQAAASSTVLPTEGDVDLSFEIEGRTGENAKGDGVEPVGYGSPNGMVIIAGICRCQPQRERDGDQNNCNTENA